jgi:hypothetical protein
MGTTSPILQAVDSEPPPPLPPSPKNGSPPFLSIEQIRESISVQKSVIVEPDLAVQAEPLPRVVGHGRFGPIEASLSRRL